MNEGFEVLESVEESFFTNASNETCSDPGLFCIPGSSNSSCGGGNPHCWILPREE